MVDGGVILSGHTDVVPVVGQEWDTDPFSVVEKDGKYFGRGTCDMKGFDALALATIPKALEKGIKRPIQIALSYDEEVGCIGAPFMAAEMARLMPKASAAIIGEPSMMKAVEAGQTIGVANKESLVSAGYVISQAAAKYGARLIPLDSEHSAIFQCWHGWKERQRVSDAPVSIER